MAAITVPAAYLEDARKAVLAEIREDGIRLEEQDIDERHPSGRILKRDVELFDALLNAETDTTLEAEHDHLSSPILDMLDTMIRQVAGRLDELAIYAPLPHGQVNELVDRLGWATAEAQRICPALGVE